MRLQLRQATEATHNRIDALAGSLPLTSDGTYALFLAAQYSARHAIEVAFGQVSPAGIAAPPPQCALLAEDLRSLGFKPLCKAAPLQFDDANEALGAAWVVSGSSMGNRAILARRHKLGLSGPERFLSDPGMPAYFRQLVPLLETTASASRLTSAISGAEKTFGLFENAFAAHAFEDAA